MPPSALPVALVPGLHPPPSGTPIRTQTRAHAHEHTHAPAAAAASARFALGDLLALELHNYVDACSEIVDRAQKELNIEKQLKKVEDTWGNLNLGFKPYQVSGGGGAGGVGGQGPCRAVLGRGARGHGAKRRGGAGVGHGTEAQAHRHAQET